MHMYDVLNREGRTGFENMAEVHNSMSEDLSFRRIIRLAELTEGTPLYMMHVSAKTGEGVESLIKEIINLIPPPKGDSNNSLQALVFDSKYDQFKGVIAYVKVVNGELQKGQSIIAMGSKKNFEALETGIFSPNLKEIDKLTK